MTIVSNRFIELDGRSASLLAALIVATIAFGFLVSRSRSDSGDGTPTPARLVLRDEDGNPTRGRVLTADDVRGYYGDAIRITRDAETIAESTLLPGSIPDEGFPELTHDTASGDGLALDESSMIERLATLDRDPSAIRRRDTIETRLYGYAGRDTTMTYDEFVRFRDDHYERLRRRRDDEEEEEE